MLLSPELCFRQDSVILEVFSSFNDSLSVPPATRAPAQALGFLGTLQGHQAPWHDPWDGRKHLPK